MPGYRPAWQTARLAPRWGRRQGRSPFLDVHSCQNGKPIIIPIVCKHRPFRMVCKKLCDRRLKSFRDFIDGNSRFERLLRGIPLIPKGFSAKSVNFCVMKCNVFVDGRMPPRKFSFQMPIDMPRVNEKKIGLYERTLEVGRLNKRCLGRRT
jgi:hypothetical protein